MTTTRRGKKPLQVLPTDVKDLHIAAYIRVSTDEQKDSGLGLDAQTAQVRAMAQVKGWPAPVIYEDGGVSGTIKISRCAAGKRLLDDIAAGTIDAVIVPSLDRLGRRAIYILNFLDDTKDKITLVSCKEFIDTSTPVGNFVILIMAGLAQLERDQISQRTTAALEARGNAVGIRSGKPPFGYTYIGDHGKEVAIVEQEARIIRRIFVKRNLGYSLRAISAVIESEFERRISFNEVKNIIECKDVYKGGKRGESDYTWPAILQKR